MTDLHERYYCRLCEQTALAGEALKLVNEYLASLKEEDCVADREYARRLAWCGSCQSLIGDTCMHCGCLVIARAKMKRKDCPDPAGSRWQER